MKVARTRLFSGPRNRPIKRCRTRAEPVISRAPRNEILIQSNDEVRAHLLCWYRVRLDVQPRVRRSSICLFCFPTCRFTSRISSERRYRWRSSASAYARSRLINSHLLPATGSTAAPCVP